MSYHFDVLVDVAEGSIADAGMGMWEDEFTSRDLGDCLHFAQRYLSPMDRYPKPVRRGALAGQVLRRLRERGVVERVRPGRWRPVVCEPPVRPSYDPLRGVWSSRPRP